MMVALILEMMEEFTSSATTTPEVSVP